MSLTFGDAKKLLSQYAGRGGKCPTNAGVDTFTLDVLNYLLISGAYGNERRFEFCAVKGCITIPFELETPLKVKMNGQVGIVWDKFFEWHQGGEWAACSPANLALYEDTNTYPTVYPMPKGGGRVGVVGTAVEAEDAYMIIEGEDVTGRVVYTHDGEKQIAGCKLSIVNRELRYTPMDFGKITGIVKSKTVGYSPVFWIKNVDDPQKTVRGFLGEPGPLDEIPAYRRFRLTDPNCGNIVRVSILGRIRLKSAYADNEIIPFTNRRAITLAGGTVFSQDNNDLPMAEAKEKMMNETIEKENSYKRIQNGQSVEVVRVTSGNSIRNIVSFRGIGRGWGSW